jgi:hypothetical protein
VKLLFSIAMVLSCSAVNASQVVLDFNELSDTVSTFESIGTNTQVTNGFQISAEGNEAVWLNTIQGAPPGLDEVAPGLSPGGGSVTINRNDGAAFDFHSFIFTTDNPEQYPNGTFSVSAVVAGGTIVTDTQVFGSYDLAGYNWDDYLAGGIFNGVTSLNITYSGLSGGGFYFDDVVVTAVPIPAALWLFGSALAGLGWFRRKTA